MLLWHMSWTWWAPATGKTCPIGRWRGDAGIILVAFHLFRIRCPCRGRDQLAGFVPRRLWRFCCAECCRLSLKIWGGVLCLRTLRTRRLSSWGVWRETVGLFPADCEWRISDVYFCDGVRFRLCDTHITQLLLQGMATGYPDGEDVLNALLFLDSAMPGSKGG